jgi:hypothetical protein
MPRSQSCAAVGADALEEHHEVEFEEEDRIDRGPARLRVAVGDEVTDKGEIEDAFQVAVEVRFGTADSSETTTGRVRSRIFGGPSIASTSPLAADRGGCYRPRSPIINSLPPFCNSDHASGC